MEENNNGADLRQKFGRRLAVIRKIRGVSQERFAADSGLARSHVSGIERGKINVSLSTIEAIAQTLSVEPKELFDFDSDVISESAGIQERPDASPNGINKLPKNVNASDKR
jgi:transcriptional regulator with XRE-family HTH domain